jgi:plastocyanin
MSFRLPSDPDTLNPTLFLPAGTRVRVTFRNEEPGVTHTFTVPAWHVDSGSLAGPGETHVEFVVPGTKGREVYRCTPHATMMHGGIVVE